MNDRLKKLRKIFGLTQQEMADKINLSRNFIAQIEMGVKEPSDRTISDICEKFDVREEWLRTGEEPMLVELPPEDEATKLASLLLKGYQGSDEMYGLILDIIRTYASLSEKDQKILKDFIRTVKNR
jgi:transcriptional regulator with XRE-family HTH domain